MFRSSGSKVYCRGGSVGGSPACPSRPRPDSPLPSGPASGPCDAPHGPTRAHLTSNDRRRAVAGKGERVAPACHAAFSPHVANTYPSPGFMCSCARKTVWGSASKRRWRVPARVVPPLPWQVYSACAGGAAGVVSAAFARSGRCAKCPLVSANTRGAHGPSSSRSSHTLTPASMRRSPVPTSNSTL